VEVTWPAPGGKTERFTNLPIDQYVSLVEGEGTRSSDSAPDRRSH
jgi:enediyne biosynthesis protein E4